MKRYTEKGPGNIALLADSVAFCDHWDQNRILIKALFELEEKIEKGELVENSSNPLSHIMKFDVVEELGPYQMPKTVLYNKNKISKEEALNYVRAGEYNENVLCLNRSQFIALFKDGKDSEQSQE